jgi:phasin
MGTEAEGPAPIRKEAMSEANTQYSKPQLPPFSAFPGVEAPAAFRDFAEKSMSHAKDNYERMRSAAEEATGVLESTYATATKGASDYGRKVLELTRDNTNAAFDFAAELLGAKTFSEVLELSSAHARKQFEVLGEQSKELAALAQKVATETAEPIKDGMTKAAKKAG